MIVAAAIKLNDGPEGVVTMPPPNRHHNIIWLINERNEGGEILCARGTQGFITDTGEFLSRVDAADHARRHGQLKQKLIAPPSLFSEDLW